MWPKQACQPSKLVSVSATATGGSWYSNRALCFCTKHVLKIENRKHPLIIDEKCDFFHMSVAKSQKQRCCKERNSSSFGVSGNVWLWSRRWKQNISLAWIIYFSFLSTFDFSWQVPVWPHPLPMSFPLLQLQSPLMSLTLIPEDLTVEGRDGKREGGGGEGRSWERRDEHCLELATRKINK